MLHKSKAQKRRSTYKLSTFELKLLTDWLAAMRIDNSRLTVEQRLKYIQYPGFQVLLSHYRRHKRRQALRHFFVWLSHFVKSGSFITFSLLVGGVVFLVNYDKIAAFSVFF